jgi:predicted CoA-binding protein
MKLQKNTLSELTLIQSGVNAGCYKKGSMVLKLMESCKGCGKPYLANIYALKKGKGLFCDHKCHCKGENNPFYGKKHSKKAKSKQGVREGNNPSTLKYWLNKGLSRSEAKQKLDHHNKSNSNRCIEFWIKKGYTKEQAKKQVSIIQSSNGKLVKQYGTIPTQIDYWLGKGYTKEQAKQKLKERQTTFSLDLCIKKYGDKKGKEIWKERQKKWLDNYKKLNYSKISQELFWCLYDKIKNDFNNIYFAQLGKRKGKDISGKNHEYFKILSDRNVFFDFFIKDVNKIIEFDGDYWHNEARGNVKRDKLRDEAIKKEGYQILHIKERDWKQDQLQVIEQCLRYIYENN